MSTNGYWEDISNLKFFTIVIILFVFLVGITTLATINGTLWTVGTSLVTSLGVPFVIYIRFLSHKRKTWAKAAVYCIFVPINLIIIFYFLQQWTTFSMYLLVIIEYFTALALIMTIAALLYERYLKHKLESGVEKK
jgi:hypothetical protein